MNGIDSSGDPPAVERIRVADSMPILLTKLHRPWVGPGFERRARLLERLDRNSHRALTLISAPAGYGKTRWRACGCKPAAAPAPGSRWMSGTMTSSPSPLTWSPPYGASFPPCSSRPKALLQAPAAPSASTVARYLMNDLQQLTDRFILALDDIHLVKQQAIFDLLAELLRHPLPSMHLVLIGRRDPPLPIASLRARGQVTEIRARDLQFTPSETAHCWGRCWIVTSTMRSRLNGRKRRRVG